MNNNSRFPALVYVCHEFPKATETFVYREVKGLRDRGGNVRVFSMKRTKAPEQIEGLEELLSITRLFPPDFGLAFVKAQLKWIVRKPIKYINELIRVIGAGKNRTGLGFSARVAFFLRGVLLASMIEEEDNFRFMHVPGTGEELISAYVAFALTGKPYGFTLHAPYALYIDSPLLAQHARDATWIASISRDARERLVKLAGEEVRSKIGIVHCGVRVEDFNPVELKERAKKKILSVGSLIEFKGHDLLVKAVALLIRRGMDLSLEVAGDGPLRNHLETLIRELGVSDKVKLLGGCHPEKIRKLLSESDAFVLASRVDSMGYRDGVPVALMEAMVMGLPCISTWVSGIPELIEDGVSGILVEPDNVQALADALERVLVNLSLAQSLGNTARIKVLQHFSLSGQVERLEKLMISKQSFNV